VLSRTVICIPLRTCNHNRWRDGHITQRRMVIEPACTRSSRTGGRWLEASRLESNTIGLFCRPSFCVLLFAKRVKPAEPKSPWSPHISGQNRLTEKQFQPQQAFTFMAVCTVMPIRTAHVTRISFPAFGDCPGSQVPSYLGTEPKPYVQAMP
jgi:hypothetical protein